MTHLGTAGRSARSSVAAAPTGGSLTARAPPAVDRLSREVYTADLAVFEAGRAALARTLQQWTRRGSKAGHRVPGARKTERV